MVNLYIGGFGRNFSADKKKKISTITISNLQNFNYKRKRFFLEKEKIVTREGEGNEGGVCKVTEAILH